VLLTVTLTGCSTGWNHRYDKIAPHIEARGFGKIIVVTREQRPDVISGKHQPQYVGTVRSMYSDPWEVVTGSGRPLAQDISSAVCNAVFSKGYECLPLVSGPAEVQLEVDYLIKKHAPVRILFFKLDQWESDIYSKTTLDYNLALDVWNGRGQDMTSVRVKGKDVLPVVTYFNPAQNASIVVPQTMQKYLEMLLNSPQVSKALSMIKDVDVLGAKY
jgi:hypothetical protein